MDRCIDQKLMTATSHVQQWDREPVDEKLYINLNCYILVSTVGAGTFQIWLSNDMNFSLSLFLILASITYIWWLRRSTTKAVHMLPTWQHT